MEHHDGDSEGVLAPRAAGIGATLLVVSQDTVVLVTSLPNLERALGFVYRCSREQART